MTLKAGAAAVSGCSSRPARSDLPAILTAGFFCCVHGGVAAESTVQLYGIADGDFRIDHTNVGTLKSVGSGGGAGSRWGLRGSEALGDGLKARFVFEQGFDLSDNSVPHGNVNGVTPTSPTSSTGSRLFSRIATVGLSSDVWGDLRFGRDYKSLARLYVTTDPFGGGHVGSIGNAAPRFILRYDNGIYYDSPTVGGLRVALQGGLGEATTDTTPGTPRNAGNRLGGGLFYSDARVTGGVAYSNEKGGVTNPLISNAVNHNRFTEGAVAVDFDVVKLHAFAWWVRDDFGYDVRSGCLGVSVPFGVWTFAGASCHVNDLGASNPAAPTVKTNYDANFFGGLATYSFSKRTRLYGSAAAFRNRSRSATYAIADGNTPAIGLFTSENVVRVNPWSMQAGITHTF